MNQPIQLDFWNNFYEFVLQSQVSKTNKSLSIISHIYPLTKPQAVNVVTLTYWENLQNCKQSTVKVSENAYLQTRNKYNYAETFFAYCSKMGSTSFPTWKWIALLLVFKKEPAKFSSDTFTNTQWIPFIFHLDFDCLFRVQMKVALKHLSHYFQSLVKMNYSFKCNGNVPNGKQYYNPVLWLETWE